MSCAYEEDLTAYVDQELPALRFKEVEGHLTGCTSCRQTEALLRRTVEQLAALPIFEPSVAMRRAVLAKLDQQPGGIGERIRGLFRPAVLMPSMGLLAASVIAVVITHNGAKTDFLVPEHLELASNMEMVEDLEVVGVTNPEDLEVVQHLHELEATP